MRLTISQKGLVLVFVPLLFELGFIGSLTYLQHRAEEAAYLSQQSRRIIIAIENVNLDMWTICANLALWAIIDQDQYREQMDDARQDLAKRIKEFDHFGVTDPQQNENLRVYKRDIETSLAEMQELIRQVKTDEPLDGQLMRNALHFNLSRFRGRSVVILRAEEKRKETFPTKEKAARQLVNLCLMTGIGLNVLACLALAIFYSKDITSRVARMVDNTARLKAGVPLHEPVSGSDEIAHLDSQFHDMAGSLIDALRKEQAIFENVADVIMKVESDLRFSRVSPSISDVLGWEPEQLQGKSLLEFVSSEHIDSLKKTLESGVKADESIAVSEELKFLKSDSLYAWVRWTIIWSAREKAYFCVMHDVTREKEVEQLKQDFTNMISHDLRTPLTAVSITLELLGSGMYGSLSDTGKTRVVTSKSNLEDLLKLVSELLDIEKLESGAFTLERRACYTSDLISNAVRLVSALAERKKIEVLSIINYDAKLNVDQDLIVRVLQNLLSNAIKFSP
ncbi:MAG: PAS domain S-box protein, partial [Cyanobacteria bacterium]|nr:PAS domain S-box protein [Cyanobacteriota bacterium]